MILSRGSRVIVSVLDWGLGHASRSSVIVRTLVGRGCRVTLAGSGASLGLLAAEFPELDVVYLRSFSPRLRGGRWLWAEVMLQVPSFLLSVLRERRRAEALARSLRPDMIVSDNRYGVRSRLCPSVIVTHQLRPRVSPSAPRWLNSVLAAALGLFIRRFDACLVPDFAIGGLSGEMSSAPGWRVPTHCIGLLSRLAGADAEPEPPVEWLGLASGPEPQRGEFVASLTERFESEPGRRVVICADAAVADHVTRGGVEVLGMVEPCRLKGLLLAARNVVSRSGYSTLMDLKAIGRLDPSVSLVPTPGQAEQVYLAHRVEELYGCSRLYF